MGLEVEIDALAVDTGGLVLDLWRTSVQERIASCTIPHKSYYNA